MNIYTIPVILLLSQTSGVPLYLQIERQIQVWILSGRLGPGEALPSLRQLAADVGVSLITTKRAYEDLEAGGWITTQVGRGTAVAALAPEVLDRFRRELVEGPLAEARDLARSVGLGRPEAETLWKSLWEEP